MISIKEAIDNGTWFHCHKDYDDWCDQEFNIRIKILSFDKINLANVDNPEEIQFLDEGIYWIMKVEAISLVKIETDTRALTNSLMLVDQDGFSFNKIM